MTLSLNDGIFDKYNEACDYLLDSNFTGRSCTIVYPPKKVECENCIPKPLGADSNSVYKHGGPMPFSFGNCPMCGGKGFKEIENFDTIRLRIYWTRKEWLKIANSIAVDNADVMVIGYISDLPKIQQSIEIKLAKDQSEAEYKCNLAGKPTPWGFGKNRYFAALLKGI